MATGIGATAESATYSTSTSSNGLAMNITVHLDPLAYVANNLLNFGQYYQAAFEFQTFKMFKANPSNRSNRQERIQLNDQLLDIEIRDLKNDTSAKRHEDAKSRAVDQLRKTFDREISDNDDDTLVIQVSSY